jgi:hypothetical protein
MNRQDAKNAKSSLIPRDSRRMRCPVFMPAVLGEFFLAIFAFLAVQTG